MTSIRRAGRATIVAAVCFCFCVAARAEGVLDVVPSDAWVVVRVNRLGDTNKKAAAWAEAMGLAQLSPQAADPLGALESELKIKGIDKSKDLAIVVLDPTAEGADEGKSLLILVPTSDYKAMAASLPNAKTQGAVTTFNHEEGGDEPGYAAQWGGYAAISPNQALVSKKPAAGIKLTGLAAKEMQDKDAVVYFNIPAMRSKLVPEIRKAREQMKKELQNVAAGTAEGAVDDDAAPAGAADPADATDKPSAQPARRPGQGRTTPPAGDRTGTRANDATADTALVSFQNQPQPGRRPQPNPRPQPTRRPAAAPPVEDAAADADDDKPASPGAPAPDPAAMMKQWMPVLSTVMDQYFNFAERFLNETSGATIGLKFADAGINTTAIAEFTPDSYMGGLAKGIKNTDANLLGGLPAERKYFAFGGSVNSPEVGAKIISDIADPVLKQLAGAGEGGKTVTEIINALKTGIQNTRTTTVGYPAPTGALGADSVIQSVVISTGNARQIHAAQRQALKGTTKLMQNLQAMAGNQPGAPKMNFEVQEGAKTVGTAKLDSYKFNMEMDADNDPAAAQAQQMLAMIYGPNGQSGVMGAISDNVFIAVQGGSDKLIQEVVTSAANPQDKLSGTGPVKAVSANLPKNRAGVFFIQLDQIITTGVTYAQGFGLPVRMQMPRNLPPIGVSGASEGTAFRIDSHIPTSTIQSIVAAGMQAAMQMQGGGNAPDGAPEGL